MLNFTVCCLCTLYFYYVFNCNVRHFKKYQNQCFTTTKGLIEKQPLEVFCKKGLKACNFIKKRLQHRSLTKKIAKFLRTPILKNIFEWLLLLTVFSKIFRKEEYFAYKHHWPSWTLLTVDLYKYNHYFDQKWSNSVMYLVAFFISY